MRPYIEYALGSLLSSQRGRDDKLFTKGQAFANLPEPIIEVNSRDCGPSNSKLSVEHAGDGKNRFPHLEWRALKHADEIKEYLLIVEDPDAPLPSSIVHGIYHSIPVNLGSVDNSNFEQAAGIGKQRETVSGFWYGQNRKGSIYMGPKPVIGHGPHRYFFQVIGLGEKLDRKSLTEEVTKEELGHRIEGKVIGWGTWIGVYERTLR